MTDQNALDRQYMGTAADAKTALLEKTRAWRETRQPSMATSAEHRKSETLERQLRFELANAALLWLWHEEHPAAAPPPDAAARSDFGTYNNFKATIVEKFCDIVSGVNGVISSACGDLRIEREHNGSITMSKRAAELLTVILSIPADGVTGTRDWRKDINLIRSALAHANLHGIRSPSQVTQALYQIEVHLTSPSDAVAAEPVPLADHNEIGRKVSNQPWEIQRAIVTIAAHCTALTDAHPTGPVADLASCISQGCLELANALAAPPVRDREAMREACDLLAERKHGNPARSPGHNARLCLESALSLPSAPVSKPNVADKMIEQIEERFHNWKSYRDLIDCIDVTLHELRRGHLSFHAAPVIEEWQDISTAPKDGSRILLFAEGCLANGEGVVIGHWYVHPSVAGWITDAFDCGDYEFNPTKWKCLKPPRSLSNHKGTAG